VQERLTILLGDVELPACDVQQKMSVLLIEHADIARAFPLIVRWNG
jgi:hypothetical protein